MSDSNPRRNDLRAHVLKGKETRRKVIRFEGEKVVLVSPTLKERAEIQAAGVRIEAGGTVSIKEVARRVTAMTLMAWVPGEDGKPTERLFDAADREVLLGMPSVPGNVVDVVGGAAVDFFDELANEQEENDQENWAKNG